jgi:hypothetical protein
MSDDPAVGGSQRTGETLIPIWPQHREAQTPEMRHDKKAPAQTPYEIEGGGGGQCYCRCRNARNQRPVWREPGAGMWGECAVSAEAALMAAELVRTKVIRPIWKTLR